MDTFLPFFNAQKKQKIISSIKKDSIKPLDELFFVKLLQLEDCIIKKILTTSIINQLVNLYGKCVEYYDTIKDPIKIYFLEKIQITLS